MGEAVDGVAVLILGGGAGMYLIFATPYGLTKSPTSCNTNSLPVQVATVYSGSSWVGSCLGRPQPTLRKHGELIYHCVERGISPKS